MKDIKIGIVAANRPAFSEKNAEKRKNELLKLCLEDGLSVYGADIIVQYEEDVRTALQELRDAGCDALVVYLANFSPEIPASLLCRKFDGPVMVAAASEETTDTLNGNRGDAYCGLLSTAFNLDLRRRKVYMPKRIMGTPAQLVPEIRHFSQIARALVSVKSLKLILFGPRPNDFVTCTTPIGPLYDIGVEIEENSDLDLVVAYNAHLEDERIPGIVDEMRSQLGDAVGRYEKLLQNFAQLELTLVDWAEEHKGMCENVAFAIRCWPELLHQIRFQPCYVNSRMSQRGMPVACEGDVYGALSEVLCQWAGTSAATILDINNTVPDDLYESAVRGKYPYNASDVFMAFHCGNSPVGQLCPGCELSYNHLMNLNAEGGGEPVFSRGCLEGRFAQNPFTLFRIQGRQDGSMMAYLAEGEVIPAEYQTNGVAGIFAIHEMERFYRYVMLEKGYPHHTGVIFEKTGRVLYDVCNMLGIRADYNLPAGICYENENPFD